MQTGSYFGEAEADAILAAARLYINRWCLGPCAIAVADVDGNIIATRLMDGCKLPSMAVASKKAFTAARWQHSTIEFTKIFDKSDGWIATPEAWTPMDIMAGMQTHPDFMPWGGGYLVRYKGQIVGAIGVSGYSELEDHEVAENAWLDSGLNC